ncbi:MAG: DUF1801 domain-containing protein [Bauldia sp.]|nr:DUF1801 domain-containing protein [Bauldia sp.]
MSNAKPATVDAYIAAFPEPVRKILEAVRATIRAAAPDAVEAMSYGIATYRLDGHPLVYFGGWKTYVSVYPLPEPPALEADMAPYRHGAGTVRFPFNAPVPHDLIARIVKARRADRGGKG